MNVWGYIGIGVLCVSGFILILALFYNYGMIWIAGKFSGKTLQNQVDIMEKELPGTDCGACGCESCRAYAYAVFSCHKEADLCAPGGPEVAEKLRGHMADFDKFRSGELEKKKTDWVKEMETLRERHD